MSAATKMTAEDFFAIRGERRWLQLIDGELVVNEPTLEHQLVQTNLLGLLFIWTHGAPGRGAVFSPLDIDVGEHSVFASDLIWLREERIPDPLQGRLEGLPDIAVEVRSPSTWHYDVGKKKLAYERVGLPELWLVDSVAETVLVFRRSGKAAKEFDVTLELTASEQLISPLLPGFSIQVERLFRR